MYVIECECGRRVETAESEVSCRCGLLLSIQGWGHWPTDVLMSKNAALSIPEVRKIIDNATNPVGAGPADSQRDNDGVTPARIEGDA